AFIGSPDRYALKSRYRRCTPARRFRRLLPSARSDRGGRMRRVAAVMFVTGFALLLSAIDSAADWKVAHWNVLHGWGRYWDNSSTSTDPNVIWPPSCPYTALSDTGGAPDGHTYTIATGEPTASCGTTSFPATWNHSSAPMQTLLQSVD